MRNSQATLIVLRQFFLTLVFVQMLVVLIDKMLKTQIVECAAVANWVFSKEMVPEFTKCYIWEIVHLTIRFTFVLFLSDCSAKFETLILFFIKKPIQNNLSQI